MDDLGENGGARVVGHIHARSKTQPNALSLDASSALWRQMLPRLSGKMSLFTFRGFFEPLKPMPATTADTLILAAPSAFHRDWVTDHYKDELAADATLSLGRNVDVEIVVGAPGAPLAAAAPIDDAPPFAPDEMSLHADAPEAHAASTPRVSAPPDDMSPEATAWSSPAAGRVVPFKSAARAPAAPGYPLDERYTFETYVEGPSNRMALAASQAVAESPGQRYSPLFLFGNSGLGKTHLLQAIGNAARAQNPHLRVVYMSAEHWVNEYITEIRNKRFDQFRGRYRNGVDLLLIDDIQFLAGKDASQDEFFHTFNSLHQMKKQIIVTADRYPHEIKGLASRLTTRLSWGLIADIQPPQMETRVAILERKATELRLSVPQEVVHFLADHIRSSVRSLEGALIRLSAYASMTQSALTLALARDILRPVMREQDAVTMPRVLDTVSGYFDIQKRDILGKSRQRRIVQARQVAMYLVRRYAGASLPEIGRFFYRDHTTVLASVRKITAKLEVDASTQAIVGRLEKDLLV